jgi:hypothetical protein
MSLFISVVLVAKAAAELDAVFVTPAEKTASLYEPVLVPVAVTVMVRTGEGMRFVPTM